MKFWLRALVGGAIAAIFFGSVFYFRRVPDPHIQGKLASQWAADLASSDYQLRGEAQSALRSLGAPAVPQLRVLLQKRNPAWEPWLVTASQHLPFFNYKAQDSTVLRQRAAQLLGLMGATAEAAIPDLITALGQSAVAPDAERALVRIGPTAQQELCRALLKHRSATVRRNCARLLREITPLSKQVVEAWLNASRDRSALVRAEIASSLRLAPSHDKRARECLLGLAKDPQANVRAAAAESCGSRGEWTPAIAHALRTLLHDGSATARLESAKAFWQLSQNAEEVLPVLIQLLPGELGWEAAYALGEMGPAAAPSVPALISRLRQEQVPRPFRTPPSSAFALGQVGLPAVPMLIQTLGDANPRTRLSAVMALGFVGRPAIQAEAQLLPLLADPDPEVKYATALTLGSIRATSDQVVPALAACLEAEDIYMRSAAASLLREIAPAQDWIVAAE